MKQSLQDMYNTCTVNIKPDLEGVTYLRITAPYSRGRYEHIINHIQVKIPPGCYVVSALTCSNIPQLNEWSERVMVIVDCKEVCVNLIVNRLHICLLQDLLAILQNWRPSFEENELKPTIIGLSKIAGVKIEDVKNMIDERMSILERTSEKYTNLKLALTALE